MVRLEVDHRERGSELLALLRDDPRFEVRVANLSVGDYVADGRVVVERKTMDDFAASVIDTRLFRQARALRRHHGSGVVILEGVKTSGRPKLGRAQLQGAIITLTMVFGVPLLRSRSPKETAWLLHALSRQAGREVGRGFVARRPNPRDVDAARIHMLMSLPNVGHERAARLLDAFGSVRAVCCASEDQLAAVPGIGRGTAWKIRRFLEEEASERLV